MVEQRPFKPKVVGSIPTAPTSFSFIYKLIAAFSVIKVLMGIDREDGRRIEAAFSMASK